MLKIKNDSSSAGSARDFGISLAKEKFIAFIDDDDIWPDDYLKLRTKLILKKNCLFSASPYIYFDENLNEIRTNILNKTILNKNDFLFKNPIANSTVIIKKSLLVEEGGYSHLKKRNDFATWLRLLEKNKCFYFKNVSPVKILRRKGSLSSKKYSLINYQFKAFREGNISILNSYLYTLIFIIRGIVFSLRRYTLLLLNLLNNN